MSLDVSSNHVSNCPIIVTHLSVGSHSITQLVCQNPSWLSTHGQSWRQSFDMLSPVCDCLWKHSGFPSPCGTMDCNNPGQQNLNRVFHYCCILHLWEIFWWWWYLRCRVARPSWIWVYFLFTGAGAPTMVKSIMLRVPPRPTGVSDPTPHMECCSV